MEVNEWTEATIEEGVLQKQIFISIYRKCSIKKGVLANFAKFTGNTCARLQLQASAWNCLKKETLTREFFCEFCEIFENTFFTEQLRMIASRYFSKYMFYHHGSAEYQADCMVNIFKKCQWRSSVLVNLQAYSLQL